MRLLLILITFLSASPAFAWGAFGHETIAGIAQASVSSRTRGEIDRLLRAWPSVETPTCPLKTLADASVWPDCVRGLGVRFDYTSSWHYQNVDICKPFDLKAACKDGNCVSRQIDRAVKLLADKSIPPRERLMALAFLTHFVGDLHMPLHGGDRGDRGGNDVKAAYGVVEGRMNLHWLWDGPLAERAISTPPASVSGLLAGMNTGERAQLSAGTPEDWSRESWGVAHDIAYTAALGDPCGPVPPRTSLDDAAIARSISPTRSQIVKAGLRLARLLDEALR
ncbi:MAG: S1/P1 nuclease [Sphingomonadaceae bacterium]